MEVVPADLERGLGDYQYLSLDSDDRQAKGILISIQVIICRVLTTTN
jgi:hypothetical protein